MSTRIGVPLPEPTILRATSCLRDRDAPLDHGDVLLGDRERGQRALPVPSAVRSNGPEPQAIADRLGQVCLVCNDQHTYGSTI